MAKRTRMQGWMTRFQDYMFFLQAIGEKKRTKYELKMQHIEDDPLTEYDGIPDVESVPRYIVWWVKNWIWFLTRHQVDKLICKRRGHEVMDVSVAGPEGGDMAWECKRCGESGYTTLY